MPLQIPVLVTTDELPSSKQDKEAILKKKKKNHH